MKKIGVSKAKSQFSSLLEKVMRGQEALITKYGRPVAKLVPDEQAVQAKVGNAIREL